MERVAFLIEHSGERVECLLNPETFTITRQAGVRPQRSLSGVLTGSAEADDPLLSTGGGTTELQLDLLFDVSKRPGPQDGDESVQVLTAPLWNMAENGTQAHGRSLLPVVHFVWGKPWNIRVVVVSVAERFEHFTPQGIPQRSWVRMRLLRCATEGVAVGPMAPAASGQPALPALPEEVAPQELQVHEVQGAPAGAEGEGASERIDQLAHRYYGDAALWRELAAFNGVDDPSRLPAGSTLMIPPRSGAAR